MDMDTFQWSSAITIAPYLIYDAAKNDKTTRVLLSTTGGTTTSVSTTSATLTFLDKEVNGAEIEKLECNKSLNTYVESMSDEELEDALVKFGLLTSDDNTSNLTK